MANSTIQILRSYANTTPATLDDGELAYSFVSNTLFIGNNTGQVISIGGAYYTSQINNVASQINSATSANTASTLVKRDTHNGFYGELYGNSETSTKLLNGRNFSIDGSDVSSSTVSFDGTGAVVLQGNLKTTGVTSGTYGGQTKIPVITEIGRAHV